MKIEFVEKNRAIFSVGLFVYNRIFNNIKKRKGNTIERNLCYMKNCKININGRNNHIVIHDFCRLINCSITVLGNNNNIIIGRRCYLNEANLYMEDNNNCIQIGNHTSIDGKTELSCIEGTTITIGEDCMFSRNIHLRTGDAHTIVNLKQERINPSKDIIIGKHVWVGTETMVMKGCVIPDNSIIAAGAIVTDKVFPNNSILGGIPAKVIKKDIDWKRERK